MKNFTKVALFGIVFLGSQVFAADNDSYEGTMKDAWIHGKIETVFALNRHLNPFSIDTDVENGIVTLNGTVESEIDRDLAEALTHGIVGVVDVRNELMVEPAARDQRSEQRADENDQNYDDGRNFAAWVDDATTTAAVKSIFLANGHIDGLQIDVDTRGDVVTLSGRVDTQQQKDLAEELARTTGDVADVRNNLVVDPS